MFLHIVFAPAQAATLSASILISPHSGTFSTDSTFDVSILVDTGVETINAIEITVEFPANKLQVVNPATGNSFVSLWLQPPTFSNKDGYIKFAGGVPGQGIKTSAGLVSTITFRAREPGTATLKIGANSSVLAGDGNGTNVLKSTGRAIYTIIQKPPAGPKTFSVTHPDEEAWYRNNNIIMGWDPDGLATTSYSYALDREPSGVPDNTDDTTETTVSFPDVADGIWYFHVKQKKNGIYGEPTHYQVKIDNTAPADFKPTIDTISSGFGSRHAQVIFFTSDALSGLDHYEIGVYDTSVGNEAAPIFVEATSPYRIPDVGLGAAQVVIRAFDKAGNFRDATVEFKSGSFIVRIVQENYIGLFAALLISGLFIWHLRQRHRKGIVIARPILPQPSLQPTRQEEVIVTTRSGDFHST
ncbi:MAG: cohesin domain-containing protein [Candidatus Yanofskybacteria bacterium]|nr:cohesin domain-containing protein [Candidatus Yanofskybacteria bacterium]